MKFILAILFMSLTMLSCGTNNQSEKNDMKFESKKWKSGNMRIKGKMTDNFLGDSLLFGKNKSEVIDMLGKPDQQTTTRLHYTVDLETEYMSSHWTYWLSVNINSTSGKVTEIWLVG